LKSAIVEWLTKGTGLNREFVPWVRGFKGRISPDGKGDYIVEGVWTVDKDMVTITELPIETWTSDFRETLEKMLVNGTIKDYVDTSTDTDVLIKVKMGPEGITPIQKILTDKLRLSNMHAFNSNGVIKKYDTPNMILNEFVGMRLSTYIERRKRMLKTLNDKLPYHENVVRFIRQQCEDKPRPELRKKTPEECDSLLEKEKFEKIKNSFDYLLNLPIASLTLKHAQKHEKDLEELRKTIAVLEAKTPTDLWLDELSLVKGV
jgi:DNA topoisomerase-2